MHNSRWHKPLAEGWHVIVRTPGRGDVAATDEQYYAWISNPIDAEQAVRTASNASKEALVFADKIATPSILKRLAAQGLVKGGAIKHQ